MQLPADAKIPRSACVKTYGVRDSQGVVWVWMSHKTLPNPNKNIPWFENLARPGVQVVSPTHELPYDHSILPQNLMDPPHIPISQDGTDWTARRQLKGQIVALQAGGVEKRINPRQPSYDLKHHVFSRIIEKFFDKRLFLCRPSGQGKSMAIVRFGSTSSRTPLANIFPEWYFHQNAGKVFEQDMGFLSSQNEILMKEKVPTKELYINLRSSDGWIAEYRKCGWTKLGMGCLIILGTTPQLLCQPRHESEQCMLQISPTDISGM